MPGLPVRPYGEWADCRALELKALTRPSQHLVAAKPSESDGGRELGPLPAWATYAIFGRVEGAKGHSAGHSEASQSGLQVVARAFFAHTHKEGS